MVSVYIERSSVSRLGETYRHSIIASIPEAVSH
jgi:hypothetical protein